MGYVIEMSGKFLLEFLLLFHAELDLSTTVFGEIPKAALRQGHRGSGNKRKLGQWRPL